MTIPKISIPNDVLAKLLVSICFYDDAESVGNPLVIKNPLEVTPSGEPTELITRDNAIDLIIDQAKALLGHDRVNAVETLQKTGGMQFSPAWEAELQERYFDQWGQLLDPVHAWAIVMVMNAN